MRFQKFSVLCGTRDCSGFSNLNRFLSNFKLSLTATCLSKEYEVSTGISQLTLFLLNNHQLTLVKLGFNYNQSVFIHLMNVKRIVLRNLTQQCNKKVYHSSIILIKSII